MSPLPQSLGVVSLSQMDLNNSVRTLVAVLRSAVNISACMESMTGAFPLFITLMAFLTSASVGGLVSMLRSSGVVRDFTEVKKLSPELNTWRSLRAIMTF